MVTVLTSYVGNMRFLIITVSVSKKSNHFGCFLQIQPSYDMVTVLPLYVRDNNKTCYDNCQCHSSPTWHGALINMQK